MVLKGEQSRVVWLLKAVPHTSYGVFDVRAEFELPPSMSTPGTDGPLRFPVVASTILQRDDLYALASTIDDFLKKPLSEEGRETVWASFHGFVYLELMDDLFSVRFSYRPDSAVRLSLSDYCTDDDLIRFRHQAAEMAEWLLVTGPRSETP